MRSREGFAIIDDTLVDPYYPSYESFDWNGMRVDIDHTKNRVFFPMFRQRSYVVANTTTNTDSKSKAPTFYSVSVAHPELPLRARSRVEGIRGDRVRCSMFYGFKTHSRDALRALAKGTVIQDAADKVYTGMDSLLPSAASPQTGCWFESVMAMDLNGVWRDPPLLCGRTYFPLWLQNMANLDICFKDMLQRNYLKFMARHRDLQGADVAKVSAFVEARRKQRQLSVHGRTSTAAVAALAVFVVTSLTLAVSSNTALASTQGPSSAFLYILALIAPRGYGGVAFVLLGYALSVAAQAGAVAAAAYGVLWAMGY